jgi:uncharacterized protein (DUF849 family)
MHWNPFITCAITGAGATQGIHPELPITPQQIADSAIDAAKAGAAIVHCHVREPETGAPSRRVDLYRDVVDRIRASGENVIVNLTTGMGGDLYIGLDGAANTPDEGSDLVGPDERIAHLHDTLPDICTLDCGSLNFGDGSLVYVGTPDYLRIGAEKIRALGIKPELECFELGHLWFVNKLVEEGLIDDPPFVQVCLGIPWGAPATPRTMQTFADQMPPNAVWSGFAISRMEMPAVAQAMLMGGNVRVGLEDNLYLSKGTFASNAQLVERAVTIVESLGGTVAGPDVARERLGLVKP